MDELDMAIEATQRMNEKLSAWSQSAKHSSRSERQGRAKRVGPSDSRGSRKAEGADQEVGLVSLVASLPGISGHQRLSLPSAEVDGRDKPGMTAEGAERDT